MKKMISKLSTFTLGAIVGITVTAGTAVGAATYLKATQSNVKIVVDGTQAKLSESPLNVNGKLYLPVRDTANAMGYSVESVTSTQVSLKEGVLVSNNSTGGQSGTIVSTPSTSNNSNSIKTTSKKVNNLKETYSTDGKLDAEKLRTALNNGTLDLNATDSTNGGNTLLMYVIEENNYEAFKAINRNKLDVNVQREDGKTALHLSVIDNNRFYFGEIMDKKPNATIKDSEGKTPLDYAEDSSLKANLNAYMLFNK